MMFTQLICTDQFEHGHVGALTPSESSGKPNGKQGQKVSIQLIVITTPSVNGSCDEAVIDLNSFLFTGRHFVVLPKTVKLQGEAGYGKRYDPRAPLNILGQGFSGNLISYPPFHPPPLPQAYVQQLESSNLKLAQLEQELQRARRQVCSSFSRFYIIHLRSCQHICW
jgi:hypothetical protein